MPSPHYRSAAIARIAHSIALAEAAAHISHNQFAGELREQALADLLMQVLPDGVRIGSGKIVDKNGLESHQIDLILYAPRLLPPTMLSVGRERGVFAIDAVLFAIEVKTTLNAGELSDAVTKARQLRSLSYSPLASGLVSAYPRANFALFAFGTDLTGTHKEELTRLAEADSDNMYIDPAIDMLCVRGSVFGMFVAIDVHGPYWHTTKSTAKYDEVLDFLSIISNSVNSIVHQRQFSRLGPYLIGNRTYRKVRQDESEIVSGPDGE